MLPRGWSTDLEILRLGGSSITEYPDHLVVETPDNPGYYWGNFILMTAPRPAQECLDLFSATFARKHLAIGLLWEPDPQDWPGCTIESESVLVSRQPPSAPAVAGYEFRVFGDADWDQSLAAELQGKDDAYEQFARARNRTRQELMAGGHATWLGAFQEGSLIGELGIVDLGGGTARYQSVQTDEAHRGRGIASHLLHLAGEWAAARGCGQLVIISETGSDAERLYQRLGFTRAEICHQVEGPAD